MKEILKQRDLSVNFHTDYPEQHKELNNIELFNDTTMFITVKKDDKELVEKLMKDKILIETVYREEIDTFRFVSKAESYTKEYYEIAITLVGEGIVF